MSEASYMKQIEHANQADKSDMERAVAELRGRMIESAFSAVKNYWKLQEESFDSIAVSGYPAEEKFDYYVLPSYVGLPFEDDEPVPSLSLLLKPRQKPETSLHIMKPDHSQMTLFVPVPEDVVFDENLIVDELPPPTYIVVELVTPGGVKTNFKIDRIGMTPFVNAVDSGDQSYDTDFVDEELNNLVSDELSIREDVEIVPWLFKTMVEWRAQVQRSIPVRQAYGE